MTEISNAMDNPIDMKNVRLMVIGTAAVTTLALIYFPLRFQHWTVTTVLLAIIITMIGASVPFYLGWDKEYWRRPYSVTIGEDGMTCYLRYGRKPRMVEWNSIMSLTAPAGDPARLTNYFSQDGFLTVRNNRKRNGWDQFVLHWPIAVAAREKYKEKMGRYPLMFPWEDPDFKGPRPKAR